MTLACNGVQLGGNSVTIFINVNKNSFKEIKIPASTLVLLNKTIEKDPGGTKLNVTILFFTAVEIGSKKNQLFVSAFRQHFITFPLNNTRMTMSKEYLQTTERKPALCTVFFLFGK